MDVFVVQIIHDRKAVLLYLVKAADSMYNIFNMFQNEDKRKKGRITMNDVLNAIMERKSVRNYAQVPVAAEDLRQIVQAAIWAPNAMNKQGWHFTVVSDPALITKMSDGCRKGMAECPVPFLKERAASENFHAFFRAPAVIVMSIAEDKFSAFDAGAAAQTLCLAAQSLGYGTCITASTEFMFAGDPGLRDALQIPEDYRFICAITLGKETDGPDDHVRDRKEDVITWL